MQTRAPLRQLRPFLLVTNEDLSLQDAEAQFDFGAREDFDKGLNELIGFPNDEKVPALRPKTVDLTRQGSAGAGKVFWGRGAAKWGEQRTKGFLMGQTVPKSILWRSGFKSSNRRSNLVVKRPMI